MRIDEDDAEQLISLIERAVREITSDRGMQGITELIDQWKADVEAGRPVERKLSVPQSPVHDAVPDTPHVPSKTRGDFIGKEEFTNLEQLEMLVDALCLAFLAPSMMSRRILDTIETSGWKRDQQDEPGPVAYLLGDPTADPSPSSVPISRMTVAQSHESTEGLAALLGEIVQDAGLTSRRLVDRETYA